MFDGVRELTSTQPWDSAEFMRKVQALVVGVARDHEPARLYVIRVDNWFGPKWIHFAGKVSVGKHIERRWVAVDFVCLYGERFRFPLSNTIWMVRIAVLPALAATREFNFTEAV